MDEPFGLRMLIFAVLYEDHTWEQKDLSEPNHINAVKATDNEMEQWARSQFQKSIDVVYWGFYYV